MLSFVPSTSILPYRQNGTSIGNKSRLSMTRSDGNGKTRRALLRDLTALTAAAFVGVPQTLAGVNFDVGA